MMAIAFVFATIVIFISVLKGGGHEGREALDRDQVQESML